MINNLPQSTLYEGRPCKLRTLGGIKEARIVSADANRLYWLIESFDGASTLLTPRSFVREKYAEELTPTFYTH